MFEAIILGIVQGLTEFLPISSSGHLVIARDFFGFGLQNTLSFDAILQLATTFSILVYFRNDILKLAKDFLKIVLKKSVSKKDKNMVYGIIIATIPAIIIGLLLEDYMDTVFRNVELVSLTLVIGAGIMLFAEKISSVGSLEKGKNGLSKNEIAHHKTGSEIIGGDVMTKPKALIIGLFQSLALVPGMSRSGMTISGGLFMGLSRVEATRFAFLMAFPILFGSGMKKLFDITGGVAGGIDASLIVGSIASFVVGLLAIHFLIKYLSKNSLKVFIWYRVILAVVLLLIF